MRYEEKSKKKSEKQDHIEKCEFWRGTKEGICPKYPQPKHNDVKGVKDE